MRRTIFSTMFVLGFAVAGWVGLEFLASITDPVVVARREVGARRHTVSLEPQVIVVPIGPNDAIAAGLKVGSIYVSCPTKVTGGEHGGAHEECDLAHLAGN